MRYIFIINPLAGKGDAEQRIRKEIDQIKEKESCEIYLTTGEGDATRFVRERCQKNKQEELRFIACGGDGTLNEVFTGAMGQKNISVSCYPCGSGNDFVKCFGGEKVFQNVSALMQAKVRDLDVLKVGERYSFNVVNFGLDAAVAITMNNERKRIGHGSKNAYFKGVAGALFTSMKNHYKVWADGELLNPEGLALLTTVANGQYVGGSFRCAPRAVTDDGWMEVCLIKPVSLLRVPRLMPAYTKGKHLEHKSFSDVLVYQRAKKVEVKAKPGCGFAYSLDGEIIYQDTFTIEILPHAISVAVPCEVDQKMV